MLLPPGTIKDTPLPAGTPPEQAYALLAAAGHHLDWHETVRTRLPQPDERTDLHLPEATLILIAYRATCDASNHQRALLLEETRIGGHRGELTYTLHTQETPTSPRPAPSPGEPADRQA